MTLLEQSQALRTAVRDTIPAGDTLDECLAALDQVDACINLFTKLDEKAEADKIAGGDSDSLAPVERMATLALVRARAVASVEKAAQDAKATEAQAAVAEIAAQPIKA